MKKYAMSLLFQEDTILFVKPNYRDYWLCPGGMIEKGETPKQAAVREVIEEVGLQVKIKKLLCVDDRPKGFEIKYAEYSRIVKEHERTFVYLGEVEDEAGFEEIVLQEDEIEDYAFWSFEQAESRLPNYLVHRIPFALQAIKAGKVFYLEAGVIIEEE